MTTDTPLLVGSVVALNGDEGPPMTVVSVSPGEVACVWFDREGKLERALLPSAAVHVTESHKRR